MGEVGQTITSLLTTAKSLDPNELLEEPSFLDRIFSSASKKVDKFIEKQKSVSEVIKSTANRLMTDCQELLTENNRLQEAYDAHTKIVFEMNDMVVAGQELKHLEVELEEIKTEAEKHENGYLQVQNYQQNLDRFAQKLENLIRSKAIISRQLVQIKIMQNTNITEVDTIRDVVTTAIPIWETNIGLGISALKKHDKQSTTVEMSLMQSIKHFNVMPNLCNKILKQPSKAVHQPLSVSKQSKHPRY